MHKAIVDSIKVLLQILCFGSLSKFGHAFTCETNNVCNFSLSILNHFPSGQTTWFYGTRNVTGCSDESGPEYLAEYSGPVDETPPLLHKSDSAFLVDGDAFQITSLQEMDRKCVVFIAFEPKNKGTTFFCSYKPIGDEFIEDCSKITVNEADAECSRCDNLSSSKLCTNGVGEKKKFLLCYLLCGFQIAVDCHRTAVPGVTSSVVEVTIEESGDLVTKGVSTATSTTRPTSIPSTTAFSTYSPSTTETTTTTTTETTTAKTTENAMEVTTQDLQKEKQDKLKEAEKSLDEVIDKGDVSKQSVPDVMKALKEFGSSRDITKNMTKTFLNATSVLLKQKNLKNLQNHTVNLMETVEKFAQNAASQLDHEVTYEEGNLEIHFVPLEANGQSSVTTRDRAGDVEIELSLEGEVNGTLVTVVYKTIDSVLPPTTEENTSSEIVSHVVSVSVVGLYSVDKPTRMTFKTSKHTSPRNCFYWNFTQNSWSRQDGCHKSHENDSHVTCDCNHMTNFAVLMSYTDGASTKGNEILGFITIIGGSISIACLSLLIVFYACLRMLLVERYMVHANLALCLLAGQLVFILGSKAAGNEDLCRLVAFLLHFFFMGSFSWTAMEGLQLYLKSVRVFNPWGDMRGIFVILGWGIPVIVVGICFALGFDHYGAGSGGLNTQSCWLHGAVRWGFIGPAIAIMLFNLTIVGLVLRVLLGLKANANKTGMQKVKSGLKALMVLVPLLGLTWVCGFLASVDIYFEYIFDICLPLQGVLLFVFHCLLNDEVKKKMKLKRKHGQVEPSSTSSSLPRTHVSNLKTITRTSHLLTPMPSGESFHDEQDFSPRKKILIPQRGMAHMLRQQDEQSKELEKAIEGQGLSKVTC